MRSALKNLLTEWDLDCANAVKRGVPPEQVPQYALVKDVLANPNKSEPKQALANFLKEDFIRDLGVMPEKHTQLMDVYGHQTFGFSIREEQHKVYWMLKEELEHGY